ncbi:MAG: bifunctional hydroxymethylpyrimidine kinase/phosphomethylpyrimidine kinase, partial [Gammaproteobacteria bacterium]
INTLYRSEQPPVARHWPRLPHSYHGSGCTLASAIAGRLARGSALEEAVLDAQAYTWESLNLAINPGKGQRLPTRVRPE